MDARVSLAALSKGRSIGRKCLCDRSARLDEIARIEEGEMNVEVRIPLNKVFHDHAVRIKNVVAAGE
jgi:hypothetical protein